jgi:hypothetical protein
MTKDMKKKWLAVRTQALAVIYLTRRRDLVITDLNMKADTGIDLFVCVERDDPLARPLFGVLVRGGVKSATPVEVDKLLDATFAKFVRRGHFAYPVCLFYFTMREDQAFFTWLAEPVTDPAGEPKLLHHKKAKCRVLTDHLLNDAVERIVRWYDALQAALVAQDGAAEA